MLGLGTLHLLRTRVLCDMMGEVEKAFEDLCHDPQEYGTSSKLCIKCRRHIPLPTKKCYTCRTNNFLPQYCNAGTRLHEFLRALTTAKMWPLSWQMEGSAVRFLAKVVSIRSCFWHTCDGGGLCPLEAMIRTLEGRVDKVKSRLEGLDLQAFQRTDESDEEDD